MFEKFCGYVNKDKLMIMVANLNSSICKFYFYNKSLSQLTLGKTLEHEQSREKNSELSSDKQGHYKSNTSNRGAYSPHLEPKEVEILTFVREISRGLDQFRNNHLFDSLIIIAPAHVSGVLHKHINKNVKDLVSHHISKDLVKISDKDLLKFLKENIVFEKYTK